MMSHSGGGSGRIHCNLLAVLSASEKSCDDVDPQAKPGSDYPFPELASSGRLEVQILTSPSVDEFRRVVEASQPNFVYLQGEQLLDSDELGSIVWGDVHLCSIDDLCELFGSALPTTVYLEIPDGEKLAEALHSKGIPYVIYWKGEISLYAACHFRQSLFSVVQSSCSHTWDAFQLAYASLRLYCVRNKNLSPSSEKSIDEELRPDILGDPPKIDIVFPEVDAEEEESSSGSLSAIKIYDDDVTMRFLVCGRPCSLDASLLGSLEDGLNALLRIEIRGSKLHNRASAPPPPLQAGTFSRGVVTMRCDLSTCSSAHISLLVSGSAQACFNDQLLENHIKNDLIESQLVHALLSSEESKAPSEPRRSTSIACGAPVFEVCLKVPSWASQVLRQLAPDVSYRSLVMLGISSIQGLSVASFEKEDAERILFFCCNNSIDELSLENSLLLKFPSWLRPPPPSRKMAGLLQETKPLGSSGLARENGNGIKHKINMAAMRPIPHKRHHKMLPFSRSSEADKYNGDPPKISSAVTPAKHSLPGPPPVAHRKSLASSYQTQQIISLNPLPLKKHGCGRPPIQVCPEEEFLRDVMQFLILRGHTRLIPQAGLAEFPDAILNAKRLDLYNLYREVVSRGGFHVGNGINWKGQVFSKMRNHTLTNRMTGVGNTLKRHYETYLLEYELAHDDVDGECCLLCHSSAAGDWVNCGICGEWAHFGCDRRQGLGAFKDYAKTDGLEYICPHCSVTTFRKKSQKNANGFS